MKPANHVITSLEKAIPLRAVKFYPALWVALLALLTYVTSLRVHFLSDDFLWIEGVYYYQGLRQAIVGILGATGGMFYRPLPRLVFWLCYQLFGMEPLGYHWFNLAFHVLNTLLVYWFARQIISERVAFLSAAFFAVHYLHVESVVWLSEFNGTLMTLFVLSTLILVYRHHTTGSNKAYLLSLLTYSCAILSKETAVILPFLLIAYDVLLRRRPLRMRQLARFYAPFIGVTVFYLLVQQAALGLALSNDAGVSYSFRLGTITLGNWLWYPLAMSVPVKFVTLSRAFWRLVELATNNPNLAVVLPSPDLLLLDGLLLSLAGLLQIGGLYFLWRGNALRRFAVVWMAITVLPVLFLSGNADRYAYLPSIGFVLLLSTLLVETFTQWKWLVGVAVALLVIQIGITQSYIANWQRASETTRQILSDVQKACPSLGDGVEVWFASLPDNDGGAFIFRNGIDAATRLVCRKPHLRVYQVSRLEDLPASLTSTQYAFAYRSGHLVNLTSYLRVDQ